MRAKILNDSKRALVIRTGAYGDMVIVSPVFRALKKLGYETYVYTGSRGMQVLKNNPHIDHFIEYEKEKEHNPNIEEDFAKVIADVNPGWLCDFSESIEVNLALHPMSPKYIYPKAERQALCNKNYYQATADWCGLNLMSADAKLLPDLYITEQEAEEAMIKGEHKPDNLNILWALSGSGANKAFPWTDYVMGELVKKYSNIHFITIGDEKCKILEFNSDGRIKDCTTNLSGEVDFRTTMALTKVVDLVVAPDTGALHCAGAWDTPKVGILGHTTRENITKYFINDESLNADETLSECAPCQRIIYDHKLQCPVDHLTGAAWCMAYGQPAKRMFNHIENVLKKYYGDKLNEREEISGDGVQEEVPSLPAPDTQGV